MISSIGCNLIYNGLMIGFFDSGIGGLTISEAIHGLLPAYDTLYIGDTARAPYGRRSHQELVAFTKQAATWLFEHGCELVIVACNTASASALREVQQTWLSENYPGKRILGVIRPTAEFLASSGFKTIAVLSTEATKKSQAYVHEFEKINPELNIISHACPNWAPMIERGLVGTPEMKADIEKEIDALEKEDSTYDAVLLACTHYPYIKNDIEASLSKKVPVFNQGDIVAQSLKDYLARHPELESKLGKNKKYEYYVTGDTVTSSKIASEIFGFNIKFQNSSI
jgi:glutamate racemase